MEMKVEYNSLCRICMEETIDLISIFHTDLIINISFAEMIKQCADSEVFPGDGLPESICHSCSEKFVNAYKLKLQTKTSERILKNSILKSNVAEAGATNGAIGITPLLDDDPINVVKAEICHIELLPETVKDDEELDVKPKVSSGKKRKSQISMVSVKTETHPPAANTEGFICQFCGLTKFKNRSRLLRHIKCSHSGHEFQCDVCPKRFKHEGNYYRHRKLVHQKHRFNCDQCPRQFHAAYNLRIHQLDRHTEGELKFTCEICDRKFKHEIVLQFHKKKHKYGQVSRGLIDGKYIRFKCDTCDKKYDTRDEYEAHQKSAHPDGNQCQDCGKMYKSDVKLKQHRLNLHSKLYNCDQCDYKTYNGANFNRHKKVHEGIKQFGCSFCDKKFSQKTSAVVHQRTHTGEKPHQCDVCSASFSDPSTLYKHKKRQHPQ